MRGITRRLHRDPARIGLPRQNARRLERVRRFQEARLEIIEYVHCKIQTAASAFAAKQVFIGDATNACLDSLVFAELFRKIGKATFANSAQVNGLSQLRRAVK
jgi:hypothetical protein